MAVSHTGYLEIIERNSAGTITSSYVASSTSKPEDSELKESVADLETRVDKVPLKEPKSYLQQTLDIFLPAGYPHSVTEDYIQYQIYDSLQAFSSSIAGLLASRAVLEGVGVGDASASPTAALLLSILQESTGRIATILFAHKLGTSLEPECKMYRLLADIFNDAAMILDCLSPAFPRPGRVLVLSFSSTLRALCGVCAGSAKASLSAHFATKGNLGELNAKDSSQETIISLLGMLVGGVVVSWVSTPMATWAALIALLSIHLATNYAAVTAVSMRSLNRQRANIVFSRMLQDGSVLSPTVVSKKERIFERDGLLRWADDCPIGHCTIGASMEQLLRSLSINGAAGGDQQSRGTRQLQADGLSDVLQLYAAEAYLLWFAQSGVVIILKEECTAVDQLKAWTQALMLAQCLRTEKESSRLENDQGSLQNSLAIAKATLEATTQLFTTCAEKLKSMGWDLDTAALETRGGLRVTVHAPGEKKR